MSDTFTPEQRHNCMSKIKGKNTKPEILVRKALFQRGFRYRINVKGLVGHPDIVLKKYNTAIFINGCFWHGHSGCKKYTIPKTNTDFWLQKIRSNQIRDKETTLALQSEGWKVVVVWECELGKDSFDSTLKRIITSITTSTE